ncbi:amino acid ABC transporter substrate-binding protein [Eubacteriales bacterium OttesenSCG-928-A19]|nr:amino acid ABC transporter substrate-binding protein [Eubacteriales bacterium OttesenSCG-928-A19]
MKKLLACLMALMMLAPMIALGETADDGSLQYVLDKGTLVVGFDPGFPPMGFADEDGEYIGFDLELAFAVCDILGVELVKQPIDWDAKELELTSKNIDCIWNGFTMTEEREKAFSFSMPYMENEQVLVVKAESEYNTLADLAGATLGVQAASSAVDALNTATEFKDSLGEVAEYDMNTVLLMDLDKGGVDVALLDVIVAGYYMSTEEVDFRVLEEALAPEKFAIGFRKEDVSLTEAVNAALIELAFNGVMEEISTDWFTTDITTVTQQVAMAEEQ